jgi:hypothetical protein
MNEQLSVTTWPGHPVPVPELDRYPDAELEGDFIYLGNRWEPAAPPPELYLRQARRLDRTNPGPLALEVARTVGGVFAPEDLGSGWARDILQAEHGARELFAERYDRSYERVELVAGRGWRVHVDEIAYRLRILDILGRHAEAYRRGNYLLPAWEGMLASGGWQPRNEREAWETFTQMITPALDVFHVRVQVFMDGGREITGLGATFLEAGALQIANDLADEVDYLNCPNCGQVFARQVGGSSYYSRRTGVTYCKPSCATAARVKAYRARKRTERTSQ